MGGQSEQTRRGIDAAVARLAERQHGIVSSNQLYALGLSKRQVERRLAAGRLHRCYRGVYAVGHLGLTREGGWMAAVLACGPGAVLSHDSAAALWELRRARMALIHVSVPTRSGRRRRAGLIIHQPSLPPSDCTRKAGIPVTTPARTLLDLARILPRRPLERAIDEAERLRLCDEEGLIAILRAHKGAPGAGTLRAVLASHSIGSTVTRSELEERFLDLCRRHDLPAPLVNHSLLGLTVDFFWPQARLVVEVDGHASHGTRAAFEDDRDRDSLLVAGGFRTMRFTWRDVTKRPAVVASRVTNVLAN